MPLDTETIRCQICWKKLNAIKGLGIHHCNPKPAIRRLPKIPSSLSQTWMLYGHSSDADTLNVEMDMDLDVDDFAPGLNLQQQAIIDEPEDDDTATYFQTADGVRLSKLTIDTLSTQQKGFAEAQHMSTGEEDEEKGEDKEMGNIHDSLVDEKVSVDAHDGCSTKTYGTRLVEYSYEDDTFIRPGQPLSAEDLEIVAMGGEVLPRCNIVVDPESPYYPFVSKHDWELASFFSRAHLSRGDIEEYFAQEQFRTPASQLPGAILNYKSFMRVIYDIPYGIPGGDIWLERSIQIPAQIPGGKPEQHTVRFRPVKECLEFLLGYRPFAKDLVWAPVKKYYEGSDEGGDEFENEFENESGVGDEEDEGPRVYDEMHTGEWWWEMQAQLPQGATIVPLILATDKTLMTKLRGNQICWPIYGTIGNLTRGVRRRQNVPSVLLLGFLPISKTMTAKISQGQDIARRIKSQLYHAAMSIILERMFPLTT
jgi:hypothetical protein